MLNSVAAEAEGKMDKVVDSLKRDYASLRAGRANPSLLDKIMIDYYGSLTPINQTANISCPEPRLILVQPWDKSLIPVICKAIMKSDLGLNPNNDGTVIRIAVPQLTEERRKELVKTCSKKAEDAKMIVRNIRRDMNARIKSLEKAKEITEDDCKRGLEDAQKLTDKYIQKIDDIMAQKEKDILEV